MEERTSALITLALTVSYNGQPFCGYAKQPGQLTVQGSLEEALSLIFRHPVETVCSGRTDSGVHARGQVISFTLPEKEWRERSEYKVLRSLNALTHESIAIKKIEEKAPDFSARFSAVSREYRYFISTDPYNPLLMQDFCWDLGKQLDIDAMNKGASYLIGEHDFKSFCLAVSAEGKPTNRYVVSIKVEPYEIWGENLVCITVVGNAFLHSMVRTIVGSLVMVGLGKRNPEWIKEVLEAKSRSAAGENAPAQGLVFWQVNYLGKRYYDPSQKEIKKEAQEKKPAKKKHSNRRGLSDVFADYLPHRGAETEFVIPRGGEKVTSGAAYSDIKTSYDNTEFASVSSFDGVKNPNPVCEEPIIKRSVGEPAASSSWGASPVVSAANEDFFSKVILPEIEIEEIFADEVTEVSETSQEESVEYGTIFSEEFSGSPISQPEISNPIDTGQTGKLPLTLSAWETGKLEPVTVANLQEGILPSAEPAGVEEGLQQGKSQAKQAMENLKSLEREEKGVFSKKVYPFQRK